MCKGKLPSRYWAAEVSEVQFDNEVDLQASEWDKEPGVEWGEDERSEAVNVFERRQVTDWFIKDWWCQTARDSKTLKTTPNKTFLTWPTRMRAEEHTEIEKSETKRNRSLW